MTLEESRPFRRLIHKIPYSTNCRCDLPVLNAFPFKPVKKIPRYGVDWV